MNIVIRAIIVGIGVSWYLMIRFVVVPILFPVFFSDQATALFIMHFIIAIPVSVVTFVMCVLLPLGAIGWIIAGSDPPS